MTQQQPLPSNWCDACQSYHPAPTSAEHHRALKCFAPAPWPDEPVRIIAVDVSGGEVFWHRNFWREEPSSDDPNPPKDF